MERKIELLMSYIKTNVAPILIDFINGEDIPESVVLSANSEIKELTGHYEGTKYMPPKWYEEMLKNNKRILVIDRIDTIRKEEQMKFVEILKYRKVSTFEIPKGCIIIVTAKEINKEKINEEIYSLVAQI